MAAKITIFRGRTYNMTYNHEDSTGAPVSLVGCTVYFTVKSEQYDSNASDSSALIQKTTTVHVDASGGITEWELNDAGTYVEPGEYFFDVIVEDASGLSEPPSLYGAFNIVGTPTNRNVGNE